MTTLISHVVSAATWDAMARHHTACSKKLRAIDTTRNCPPRPPPPAAAARPPAVAAARRNCPPPPAHPPPLRVAITHPAAVAVTVTETRKRSAPCGPVRVPRAGHSRDGPRQGLTLVHFSAQPEPCIDTKSTHSPIVSL